MANVKPIPDGYPQVSPYLCVDDAGAALDFYTKVLGAKERMRMADPDGKIGHAELQLGDSVIMLADEYPDIGIRSPKAIGGSPVTLSVYVEDVDTASTAPLRQAPSRFGPSSWSSTETGPASSRILSDIAGVSPRTSKTSHPRRWRGARPSSRARPGPRGVARRRA